MNYNQETYLLERNQLLHVRHHAHFCRVLRLHLGEAVGGVQQLRVSLPGLDPRAGPVQERLARLREVADQPQARHGQPLVQLQGHGPRVVRREKRREAAK